MTPLERAVFIAVQAHAGARDKAGEAYILHPLRMMMKMRTEAERVFVEEGGTMSDPKQREVSISQIERLPAELEKVVTGLGERELESRYRQGSWTVRQLVHHLADAHANAYIRMKLTLTEDRPTVKPYDQDEWSKLEDARTLPIASSLDIIRGVHHRWTVLMRSIPEEAWSRKLFHPERGELALDDLLELSRIHGERHLEQIRAALRR